MQIKDLLRMSLHRKQIQYCNLCEISKICQMPFIDTTVIGRSRLLKRITLQRGNDKATLGDRLSKNSSY